ncbi:DNA-processing protein DprA [Klugiella xanthotipulae]|uniref:DNA processing protein n=2 Tax=Klugiella xanthotipulae TaxID=244735 RepID=A0A543HT97_9MICO|nr:DNA processing protein [Klugiella xanthotipulae]TQM65213.1 DNA processing protein [Klugiella xanthotipulae]
MVTIASLAKDERAARIVLAATTEPGDTRTGRLVTAIGAVETVRLAADEGTLPEILDAVEGELWSRQVAPRLLASVAKLAMRETDQLGLEVLVPGDASWPAGLNGLQDREPLALWMRGATSFLSVPLRDRVTFTGARAATSYGVHVTTELASDLAKEERIIVSGGSYGIDATAHRAAMAAGGSTIAVLPGGLDRPYPAGNRNLLRQVGDVGLLVSELPPGTAPTRWRFLARNRLLAALSSVTIVPEAGYRSGALGVVHEAHLLGREVGAVPGPITSVTSAGTHRLMREGIARLVTNTQDVDDLIEAASGKTAQVVGRSGVNQHRRVQVPPRSL